MMDVKVVTKPAFSVLGIEGKGPAEEGPEWVAPLWEEVERRIKEVEGRITGDSWGLMGAPEKPLARWGEEGTYLAGWQASQNVHPPDGWTLWHVPETTFAVIACTMRTYGDAWNYVHHQFLEESDYVHVGAVHEHYPPGFEDPERDIFHLYFTLDRAE
jgi:predicted transcriptional regulator YdeE